MSPVNIDTEPVETSEQSEYAVSNENPAPTEINSNNPEQSTIPEKAAKLIGRVLTRAFEPKLTADESVKGHRDRFVIPK